MTQQGNQTFYDAMALLRRKMSFCDKDYICRNNIGIILRHRLLYFSVS